MEYSGSQGQELPVLRVAPIFGPGAALGSAPERASDALVFLPSVKRKTALKAPPEM
jgi:hypothetical protein